MESAYCSVSKNSQTSEQLLVPMVIAGLLVSPSPLKTAKDATLS
jgi:hypothetical protein